MHEEQTVKEVLRLEYLKEIVKKWIDNGKLEEDEVQVGEKVRVIIETSPRALVPVLRVSQRTGCHKSRVLVENEHSERN